MNTNNCPQCHKEINESTNRLIQDACGHKKCRLCLVQEENGCKICKEKSDISSENLLKINNNASVIKYDHKTVIEPTEERKISNEGKHNENNDNEIENIEDFESHNKIPHVIIITRSPISYKCTICSKSFTTNTSVKYHSYCAGKEKPLRCEICNKGFIIKSHLETHKLKHNGIRPFSCTKCEKSFTQKSKLNRHLKLHTGEKPFSCTECGKQFSNKDSLTGHFRLHSGERPYCCKQCGTRFNNKSNLTKHLATHTKEKLFMCEECGKKFGNKWALVSHRKCHNTTKPHSCQKCSKSFAKIKDLKRHNLSHLDIKPFCCNLCNMRFCRKDNLERHLKNTHSIKDVKQIKSATVYSLISDKEKETRTLGSPIKISETETVNKPIENSLNSDEIKSFQENPNAINVIKMLNKPSSSNDNSKIQNAVPVINGPVKLAFKTDAFKNNYNILPREYNIDDPPRIQSMKPYDMRESLNICQKILSPMTDKMVENNPSPLNKGIIIPLMSDKIVENNSSPQSKNVIMNVGKVNEKDSLEICKKILIPNGPLHYETSFEHKKHADIKNIKFKLPSTYTSNAIKSNYDFSKDDEEESKEYTELQPVNYANNDNCKQSVIVNNMSSEQNTKGIQFSEIHWRRRTAQNFQPKLNNNNTM